MTRLHGSSLLGRLGFLLLGMGLLSAPAHGQTAQEARSALDGVYTSGQASAGEQTWSAECSLCHATREFTGRMFEIRWANRSVDDLFQAIKMTMPFDRPGGLTDEQYAALVSYLLELNDYPSGDEPLGTSREKLSQIVIEVPGSQER